MKRPTLHALTVIGSFDPLVRAATEAANLDDTLLMDEDAFRVFYAHTAGMLWAYLARTTGDRAAADDLLQEAYYRLLRSRMTFQSDDHRKNYLFRIATNLIRDRARSPFRGAPHTASLEQYDVPASGDLAVQTQQRADLQRAMAQLTERERELVWLAYGQGSTHQEIAGALGLKTGSIKPLLFRARRKLAAWLKR